MNKHELASWLTKEYNIRGVMADDASDKLLKIHGIDEESLDYSLMFNKIIRGRLSDISIDDNSNKSDTLMSVEGAVQDAVNPIKKMIGYSKLMEEMIMDHGLEEARRLMMMMMDLTLGLSDSTNILRPYCWAMSATELITEGRKHSQLESSPCKHILSYMSNLSEMVHHISNHIAGAVGIGTFFVDLAYLTLTSGDVEWDSIIIDGKVVDNNTNRAIEQAYQQFVYSVNHLSRSNVESPFTNISIFDKNKLEGIVEDLWWIFDGKKTHDGVEITKEMAVFVALDLQAAFMKFFDKGDVMSGGKPYRFPVVTINISKNSEGEIIDPYFVDYISKNHDVPRYNIFVSEGTKIASCCRLIGNDEMLSMAGSANSFGGSSISLGSHRVITVNMNRAVLRANSMGEAINNIASYTQDAIQILSSHRNLLHRYADDYNLHPFIGNIINMKRMFSTVGVLGLYEAALTAISKFELSGTIKIEEVMMELALSLQEEVDISNSHAEFVTNIEQIPAESFAVRLVNADKIIFGEEEVPFNMYANQYIPLWETASIWERLTVDGRFNHIMTGGGIVHAPVDGQVSPEMYKRIINFAVKQGSEHFAISAVYVECDNGHITTYNGESCSICGAPVKERYTRVIGYFTPVSSWNKTRRTWEFPRRKHIPVVENIEKS